MSESLPTRSLTRLNRYQQRHKLFGFPYAVIKKYGDDEAAYEGALITYYGFLSLFPLLLVVTSILQLVARYNPAFRDRVTSSFNAYFPIVGDQLQHNVHGSHSTGIALVIGLLVTFYGARGGANALDHALNKLWQVPRSHRAGFPKSALKSLAVIVVGGGGLLLASVLSGYAAGIGSGAASKIVPTLLSITILFAVLTMVFKMLIDRPQIGYKDVWVGAVITAVGLQILQTIGGYFLTHQLANLKSLYGTFAVVLGMMAWIYLQAQLLLYAVQIDIVRQLHLWPRSLQGDQPNEQDKLASKLMYTK